MPRLGEICHGADLGKMGKHQHNRKYVFVRCLECGSERWIMERRERTTSESPFVTCHFCTFKKTRKLGWLNQGRGEKAPRWKGGRSKSRGYIVCRIYDDNPYYPMAVKAKNGAGDILEHRLIMAQHLGRLLTKNEHVHHKNGDKEDNHLENLELVSQNNHHLYNVMCAHCSLRAEIRKLKRENTLLKAQLPTLC